MPSLKAVYDVTLSITSTTSPTTKCEISGNFSSNVHAEFRLIPNIVHISVILVGEITPISDHHVFDVINY